MRARLVLSLVFLLSVAQAAFAQEWTEFVSPEERFTVTFPGTPTVTETTWTSQYGVILPARRYTGVSGASRYSVLAVDYNPVERLLSERSRSFAALDLAVHEYGTGYWKTDVRSATLWAAGQFLEREGKASNLLASLTEVVQGLVLQVANPDGSRTHASVYMHENFLIIAEATVPKGAPAPIIFQQSIGWLDAQGRRIRYLGVYHNEPNDPKPPFRFR